MGHLAIFATVSCAVNPAAGREKDYALSPALIQKNVMIVGGGIEGGDTTGQGYIGRSLSDR
ncbi:hypothetical protein P4S72_28375 [Vibrio sp. PP-XX7]